MKSPGNPHLYRSHMGKRYRLAQFLHKTADEVMDANKPSDLTFTISRTLDLVSKIREHQYEWLERNLKLRPEDRGRWPHL